MKFPSMSRRGCVASLASVPPSFFALNSSPKSPLARRAPPSRSSVPCLPQIRSGSCVSFVSVLLLSTLTNDTQLPERICGKHGTLDLDGGALRANGDFGEEFKAKNEGGTEAKLATQPRRDMEGNFIDVLRGKGDLHCNGELGAATMVAIKLAVESYRQKKTMLWDP